MVVVEFSVLCLFQVNDMNSVLDTCQSQCQVLQHTVEDKDAHLEMANNTSKVQRNHNIDLRNVITACYYIKCLKSTKCICLTD